MHRPTSPGGSPFAAAVIGRLRYTVTLDDRSADLGRNAVQVAPIAEPDPVDPSSGNGHDRYDPDAEGEDGFCAPAAHPDRSPSVEQILLTLRPAATLRTREGFEACLALGAVTVLSGLRPEDVRPVAQLLRLGFLPPGCRVLAKSSQAVKVDPDAPRILLVKPNASGPGIDKIVCGSSTRTWPRSSTRPLRS